MGNFYRRFVESVERWPEQVAMELRRSGSDTVAGQDRYTFTATKRMSDAVGAWLMQQGIARDTKCAILAGNGPRWVACFMGVLAAGGVVVPFDTALNQEQLAKLLRASDTSLLFIDEKHRGLAEHAAKGLEIRMVLLNTYPDAGSGTGPANMDAILAGGLDGFRPAEVDGQDVAAILYSSGTTGDPKGVMLTHDNFAAETEAIQEVIGLGPEDSILGILPLFHALALMTNVLLPMGAGARVVFLESLNTTELLRALPSVNIFVCVPQFFYLIHERIWKEVNAKGKAAVVAFRALLRISRLARKLGVNLGKIFFRKIHVLLGPNKRLLGTGGSRFDAEIGHEFEDLGFVMLQGYGLTETTGCATYTPPGKVDIRTVGRPLPGVEAKILNAQARDGRPPSGEIALRGRIVMKGYYKRPDATEQALEDGWLRTGDLGYLDSRGNVVITGREKEVIVLSSGKNVYPEEIEAHYLKTPLIKEICVLGLQSRPGEPVSERLHGVVVPNFELLRQKKIVNTREVLRFEIENLSVQLPSTKRILSYEIWQEDLPRTTTRKLKRFEIEKRVGETQAKGAAPAAGEQPAPRQLSDEERAWLELPDVGRAMAVIRETVKEKKADVHPHDNLELDLGLDSMERVELLVAIERKLGGHIDDSVVAQVYTVRELVDAVRQAGDSGTRRAEAAAWDTVLQTEPTDPDVLAVIEPTPLVTRFLFLLTRFAHLLARDLFHLRVEGIEKLPASGPFILSANHQSFLDPPVLLSAVPWRVFQHLFYVGTSEIFSGGVWRWIARALKLIPVDPDANLVPAMRAGAYGLRHGKVLVLYPEGERSIDGIPKTFKKGAAILATHLRVPIYPVALDGFHEAWPRGKKFQKFVPLRIVIGDAIYPPEHAANPEKAYDELTQTLRRRVVDMWDELHRELYPPAESVEEAQAMAESSSGTTRR